jgi:hypothetical protein
MKQTARRFALLVTVLWTSTAQAAQYVVAEARGIGIPVGSVLDPTRPLVLRQGQHLGLISESGQMINLNGPYQRAPIQDQGVTVTAALGGLITERNARTSEIGAVRGAAPKRPLPSPWLIDASQSGIACLRAGDAPVLWRPDSSRASALQIASSDRSWTALSVWPSGRGELMLDPKLGMHADASYFIALDKHETAVTLAAVPATASSAPMQAAWMIARGCIRQAEALLRTTQ